ncbi:unnamed protein product [Amoebophrya sp. A120]|nr:unnamed protein product [Amoebophrya sp. A120]|eukprot:GSA120T00004242001.1
MAAASQVTQQQRQPRAAAKKPKGSAQSRSGSSSSFEDLSPYMEDETTFGGKSQPETPAFRDQTENTLVLLPRTMEPVAKGNRSGAAGSVKSSNSGSLVLVDSPSDVISLSSSGNALASSNFTSNVSLLMSSNASSPAASTKHATGQLRMLKKNKFGVKPYEGEQAAQIGTNELESDMDSNEMTTDDFRYSGTKRGGVVKRSFQSADTHAGRQETGSWAQRKKEHEKRSKANKDKNRFGEFRPRHYAGTVGFLASKGKQAEIQDVKEVVFHINSGSAQQENTRPMTTTSGAGGNKSKMQSTAGNNTSTPATWTPRTSPAGKMNYAQMKTISLDKPLKWAIEADLNSGCQELANISQIPVRVEQNRRVSGKVLGGSPMKGHLEKVYYPQGGANSPSAAEAIVDCPTIGGGSMMGKTTPTKNQKLVKGKGKHEKSAGRFEGKKTASAGAGQQERVELVISIMMYDHK